MRPVAAQLGPVAAVARPADPWAPVARPARRARADRRAVKWALADNPAVKWGLADNLAVKWALADKLAVRWARAASLAVKWARADSRAVKWAPADSPTPVTALAPSTASSASGSSTAPATGSAKRDAVSPWLTAAKSAAAATRCVDPRRVRAGCRAASTANATPPSTASEVHGRSGAWAGGSVWTSGAAPTSADRRAGVETTSASPRRARACGPAEWTASIGSPTARSTSTARPTNAVTIAPPRRARPATIASPSVCPTPVRPSESPPATCRASSAEAAASPWCGMAVGSVSTPGPAARWRCHQRTIASPRGVGERWSPTRPDAVRVWAPSVATDLRPRRGAYAAEVAWARPIAPPAETANAAPERTTAIVAWIAPTDPFDALESGGPSAPYSTDTVNSKRPTPSPWAPITSMSPSSAATTSSWSANPIDT